MDRTHQIFDDMRLEGRPPIPETLYHYTSMEGLRGIVTTGKIWATHIKYLNDSLEYEFLWELLRNRIQNRLDSSGGQLDQIERDRLLSLIGFRYDIDTYVTSFSADGGDRLSQWRGYCPSGTGFSVGFSGPLLENYVVQRNRQLQAGEQVSVINRVKYLSETDTQHFDDIIDGKWEPPFKLPVLPGLSKERFFSTLMSAFASMYKHDSFGEEDEWRLILSASVVPAPPKPRQGLSPALQRILYERSADSVPGLKFRSGKSTLIPYREVDLKSAGNRFVKTVTIGPTPHKEMSMKAVHNLLHSSGLEGYEIRHSRIPYRSW